MSTQRRPLLSLALAVLVAVSAVGCSSPPPARLVAIEMIETFEGQKTTTVLTSPTQRSNACLRSRSNVRRRVETIALSGDQIVLDSFSSKLSACGAVNSPELGPGLQLSSLAVERQLQEPDQHL